MSVVSELFGDIYSLCNFSFITLGDVVARNSVYLFAGYRHGIGGVTS